MKKEIYFNSEILDGDGMRITKDFLEKLTIQFRKVAEKYINVTSEAPFAYKERQLNSILAPALFNFTDAFLMECPINRHFKKPRNQEREKGYLGWVDFWATYRGLDFLIEVKHGVESVKSFNLKQNNYDNWDFLINKQAQGIRKDARNLSLNNRGVVIIPIHVITLYDYRKISKDPYDFNLHNLVDIFQKQFEPNPNWIAVWELNDETLLKCKYEINSHTETYPAVLFFAKVDKVIK